MPSIDITGKNPLPPEYALCAAAESKGSGTNTSILGGKGIILVYN